MLKVAILDDYQNVAQEFVDLKKLSGKFEIEVFNEPFESEEDATEKLKDFEALLIMRERTKITANLVNNLKKLKYIATSGMTNKSIDLEACKKKKSPYFTNYFIRNYNYMWFYLLDTYLLYRDVSWE